MALIYLNIIITETHKDQLLNKTFIVKDAIIAQVKERITAKLDTNDLDLSDLFTEFSPESDRFLGISSIFVTKEDTGKIIFATTPSLVGKPVNQTYQKLLSKYDNLRKKGAKINIGSSEITNIFFFDKLNLGNRNGVNYQVAVVVDIGVIGDEVTEYSLLLMIISVFLVLIIFVTIFLISSKVSLNIKLIKNSLDNLAMSQFEITLPQANDELGEVCVQVDRIKEILINKKNELENLEKTANMLNDRKFASKTDQLNSLNSVFAILNIVGIHQHFQSLKTETKKEIIISLTEFINDNIHKQNGKIINFNGTSFLLSFTGKDSFSRTSECLQKIRQKMPLFCTQHEIPTHFTYHAKAAVMEGKIDYYQIHSGTLDFKVIIGEVLSILGRLLDITGNDEIIFILDARKTNQAESLTSLSLKELVNLSPDFKEEFDYLKTYLLETNIPSQSQQVNSIGSTAMMIQTMQGSNNTPIDESQHERNDPPTGGIASMLEETLKQ